MQATRKIDLTGLTLEELHDELEKSEKDIAYTPRENYPLRIIRSNWDVEVRLELRKRLKEAAHA